MNVVEKVRRDRVDLARVLKRHRGIRRIVEGLYPDSAHFIYELLQNAEDTGANEAYFDLSKGSLVFEHDGRPFDRRDIEAITDIGEGAKSTDDDKIGRFGVGFKAVFAYTETPHIWSPTYSFKITDLVLPKSLPPNAELGEKTRFEFPFDNPEKTPQDAFREIDAGLADLAETTLLFLSHLQSIRWRITEDKHGEVRRIEHTANHVKVVKLGGGETRWRFSLFEVRKPRGGAGETVRRSGVRARLSTERDAVRHDRAASRADENRSGQAGAGGRVLSGRERDLRFALPRPRPLRA